MATGNINARLTVAQAETCTDDCVKAVSGKTVGAVDRVETALEDVHISTDVRVQTFRDKLVNDRKNGVQRFDFKIKLADLLGIDTDSSLADCDGTLLASAERKS